MSQIVQILSEAMLTDISQQVHMTQTIPCHRKRQFICKPFKKWLTIQVPHSTFEQRKDSLPLLTRSKRRSTLKNGSSQISSLRMSNSHRHSLISLNRFRVNQCCLCLLRSKCATAALWLKSTRSLMDSRALSFQAKRRQFIRKALNRRRLVLLT